MCITDGNKTTAHVAYEAYDLGNLNLREEERRGGEKLLSLQVPWPDQEGLFAARPVQQNS